MLKEGVERSDDTSSFDAF